MVKVILLRFVAVTLLVGGAVRVFATRTLFEAFGIGALWMETPYSVYIYRVLGALVVLAGIVLMIIGGAPEKYRGVLRGYALGFAIIGAVMVAAGLTSGLPLRYYLPDPAYCFLIVALLWHSSR